MPKKQAMPTLLDLLMAVGVLDGAIARDFASFREKFPNAAPPLDAAERWLRAHWVNAKLHLIPGILLAELSSLSDGKGPVTHDPVDVA